METITLKINTRNNKGKYLLGLIREMAKEGTFVEILQNATEDSTKGLEQVKKIRSGELPKRSVKQMLHGK